MKGLLITNPLSGSYNDRKINLLISSLNKRNVLVERYDLKEGENISFIMKSVSHTEYTDLILAFGDGTINSACNALLERDDYDKFNILVVPMGTANTLSIELNCNSIEKSVKSFLKGKTKKINLGIANGRYFTLMTSAGFDSFAVKNTGEKIKRIFGRFSYFISIFKSIFFNRNNDLLLKFDNEEYRCILACIMNSRYYVLKSLGFGGLENGLFNIVLIEKFNLVDLFKFIINKKENNTIKYFRSDKIDISANRSNFPVQVDGDYLFDLPVVVSVSNMFLNFYYLDE